MQRYQPRLLAFCRHMLSSQEDAEDVLQEVFTAAYNAMRADDRPINARPWLYRIARNRSLNHLRRPQHAGLDSMDIFERDGGATTADTVHRREEFRQIVADVGELPETQRTALLLREIDALSYDQIAEAMETTVPSVKSLLVRARVALAEAAEARLLTCGEVRLELGQVAEGVARTSAPVRRHLKSCDRCRTFRGELRKTSRALAAIYPLGPVVLLKKLWIAKVGIGGAGAAATGAGSAGAGMAGVAGVAAGGITAGGAVSAGVSTLASKAAAGMAAAVIVTAGAVEVKKVSERHFAPAPPAQVAQAAPPPAAPAKQPVAEPPPAPEPVVEVAPEPAPPPEPVVVEPGPVPVPEPVPAEPVPEPVQEEGSTVILPPREKDEETEEPATPPGEPEEPAPPPGETGTGQPPPAPPAGEPGGSGQQPPPPPPPPPS